MTIITNADGLDPVKKAALQREDDQIEHVADQIGKKIATADEDLAPMVWDSSRENVVTHDQIAEKRGEEFAPVKAIGYETDAFGNVTWKLSPYHYEMVRQGRVCHACLEWQSEVQSERCLWRGKADGCGNPRVGNSYDHLIFGGK